MSNKELSTDLLIIGGGPAGLAASITACRKGLSAIVIDHARPPIDKACGEGLMPDSLAALHDLGIDLSGYEVGTFHGISFISPDSSVSAKFPQGAGLGIRRTLLHTAMVSRAESLGAEIFWGSQFSRIEKKESKAVLSDGRVIRYRWLIGADGQNSKVKRLAELSACRERGQRYALRQHYSITPWSDSVEIYWGEDGQAYITPIGPNEVCVALISKHRMESFYDALSLFPKLAGHLKDAPQSTSVKAALTISRRLNAVYRNNIALIGEASGSVDAITGEGMALAFRQAKVLAEALAANDLSIYQTAHRKIGSLSEMMARTMLLMDKSCWMRKQTLAAFQKEPGLFERLLSIHVGELRLSSFGARGFLNLGWKLLTA